MARSHSHERLQHIVQTIAERQWGRTICNEALSSRTTWKVGGPADVWFEPANGDALVEALALFDAQEIPWVVLGKGSNTLASDRGFRGVVVNLEKGLHRVSRTEWDKDMCAVEAEGGAPIAGLLRFAAKENVAGLEVLTGIPGTVGGAVKMNAGTHLGELKDCLERAWVRRADGTVSWEEGSGLALSYRHSNLGPRDVVLAARFRVRKDKDGAASSAMRTTKARRRETQPLTEPSAGSTFANPAGHRAWSLLDAAGLRGYRIGGAWFSTMHPNFLVQGGEATAEDMEALIRTARERVFTTAGIVLREEVSRLGEWGWVEPQKEGNSA